MVKGESPVTTNAGPVSAREAADELARIRQRLSELRDPETLTAEISAGEKQLTVLHSEWVAAENERIIAEAKARSLSQKAQGIEARIHQSTIRALNDLKTQYVDILTGQPAPKWSGWGTDAWAHFEQSPSPVMLDHVRVGSTVETDLLSGETGIGDIPFMMPLLEACGAILILCDTETAFLARSIVQSTLLRAALAMPTELRFTLIDPEGLGSAFPFHAQLTNNRALESRIANALDAVLDGIRRINRDVVGFAPRFLDLSAETRAGETFELIAAVDFPQAYARDPRVVDQLTTIANSGWHAGRHLILEVHADQDLPRDFTLDQFKQSVVIDCRQLKFSVDPLPPADSQRRLLNVAAMVGSQRSVSDW